MRIFSSKRKGLIALALTAAAVLIPAIAIAGWGPSRPTYTWGHPADHITFNSITDNPVVGDERPFLSGKVTTDSGNVVDNIKVKDNDVVSLRVFYHNNAAANLNLTSTNTRVSILLPGVPSSHTFAAAYISSDNANPRIVSDSVDFSGNENFTVEYVPGSAQLWNNALSGASLSDSIITTQGALIGFDKINGKVPGCEEFSGYVTIKVKIHMNQKPQPAFACTGLDVNKLSRTRFDFTAHGSATNATILSYIFTAKDSNGNVVDTKTVTTGANAASYTFDRDVPGTYTVSAVVHTNKGDTPVGDCTKQITVEKQEIPPAFACTGLDVNKLSRTRFDFTAHGSATNATILSYIFTAKDSNGNVVDTKTVTTGANAASYTFDRDVPGTYTVSAVVHTNKGDTPVGDCTKQITVEKQVTPKFSCDNLDVNVVSDRTIKATVSYTADGGAVLKSINYDFGDGNKANTTNTTVNHTYSKDGTYEINATLSFNVGGTDKTATCSKKITITTPPTPVFKCDNLSVNIVSGRTVKATVSFTATGGAIFRNATYDFGDGTTPLVTDQVNANHTYDKDGTFTVTATLKFNVGGTDKTANCSKTITITTPTTPPTQLPNTGAGSTIGMFVGASAIAGIGHFVLTGRRARS